MYVALFLDFTLPTGFLGHVELLDTDSCLRGLSETGKEIYEHVEHFNIAALPYSKKSSSPLKFGHQIIQCIADII